MTENIPPATVATVTPSSNNPPSVPGQPFYEKNRQVLKELLRRRQSLERSLAIQEEAIYKKETEYLEETPAGNIITGFENYTKAAGAAAPGTRRRVVVDAGNRLFSRSSYTWNVNAVGGILSSCRHSSLRLSSES